MTMLYKEKIQKVGSLKLNAHCTNFEQLCNVALPSYLGKPYMILQCKDVGSYATCLRYTFSMGTYAHWCGKCSRSLFELLLK